VVVLLLQLLLSSRSHVTQPTNYTNNQSFNNPTM
jgi:hypothetical protein